MAVWGWLTPDQIPGTYVCRVVFIPDNECIIGAVNGAISALANAENWEKFGAVEPEEIAVAMLELFNEFQESSCMPIGAIIPFAGDDAPAQYLLCDGAAVAQARYPALFSTIGHRFGIAPAGQFRLPDMRGRVPVGAKAPLPLSYHSIGAKWGSEKKALSGTENGPHAHMTHSHLSAVAAPGAIPVDIPNPVPGTTGSSGLGTPFNLSQPSIGLSYIIRAL